jgi:aryl-alcohol dehydrogenase-like predicted oxidoreductase
MKYRILGKSGLRVSELCLGTMTFGREWGFGTDKKDSKKVFDAFVNAGGNFLDTANLYNEGTSEKYTGEFIASQRDYFVLATKYTLHNPSIPKNVNASGNSRKSMINSVEDSLKRMKTDYIDLLWVHVWDAVTPIDEMMRGLDDLVSSGKVLYVGVSDTPAWVVSSANTMAEIRGWSRFVALQIEYSLIQRGAERDLIPMANDFDLAITPWGTLGGGALTGKYLDTKDKGPKRIQAGSARLNEKNTKIAAEVKKISDKTGIPGSIIALNWVRQKPGLFIPIVGSRTDKQLIENMKCVDVTLPDDVMKKLDEVSKIEYGFPHDFIFGDVARRLAFSGQYENIINHRKR